MGTEAKNLIVKKSVAIGANNEPSAPGGFLVVDKPSGVTSFDVIRKLRKLTGVKRIGHGGTLDPFATGVLVVAIGRDSTRRLTQFLAGDKVYSAKIKLGEISDTFDRDGKIQKIYNGKPIASRLIKKTVQSFIGEIEQIPPKFSALKVRGKPAYDYARSGEKIVLAPRKVRIYDIRILTYKWPFLEIRITCGKGTYIRSLANDIGAALNCGGYLEELRRERVGEFDINQAIKLPDLKNVDDVKARLIRFTVPGNSIACLR